MFVLGKNVYVHKNVYFFCVTWWHLTIFECCWLSEFIKGVFVFSPTANCGWQVSSLSETKAHQVMQQKATSFIHFNQQQLSRIYPSSYRVDSSNFNPQPFWNAGCQLGMSTTATQQVYHVTATTIRKTNRFDFSCTQLPVRGPRSPTQQSQILQQWQLWLHCQTWLHVWRSAQRKSFCQYSAIKDKVKYDSFSILRAWNYMH